MKLKITLMVLTLGLLANMGHAESSLVIEVQGFDDVRGRLMGAFYRTEEDFLNGTNLIKPISIAVTESRMALEITGLPNEPLIFSVFPDVNDNGNMDRNLFGIPKEPYGFSNDARGRFGPPKFEDALFVPESTDTLIVNLK